MPNAGFLEDVVFEDPSLLSSSQASDSFEGSSHASIGQQSNVDIEEGNQSLDAKDVIGEPNLASTTQHEPKNDAAEQIIKDVGDLKLIDSVHVDEPNVEEQHLLSAEDVDACLDKCLLQALHTTVKDKDLPMPGSTLW